MNADQINAKIYAGRGKAALRLGLSYTVMRPNQAANPLANPVATIQAALNAGDNAYRKPNLPGSAFWFADMDGTVTQPGDYLVRQSGGQTYYIAGQQPLLPIICVECNRSIRIARAPSAAGSAADAVGALEYNGLCLSGSGDDAGDVLGVDPAHNGGVFTGWPCSILFGKGKLRTTAGLPLSASDQMGWMVMLPPSVPVAIMTGDMMFDDAGRSFTVNGAEQSDTGWRIAVIEVHP